MPEVLTTASVLRCAHGGRITVPAGPRALTVAGAPVLVRTDLDAATVTGCPQTNAAAGQSPCLRITALLAGAAATLTVGGVPVLLASARGLTDGVPPLPVMWRVVSAGQRVLVAS
ncbi:hypothetical protein JNUCC64_30640 [Streptomyces sp. JNUCC 64]